MEKPNILFILVDALRSDMVFGNARHVVTPNLDGLKKEGAGFGNLLVSTSMSSSSIASMLTGTYGFVHGIETTDEDSLNASLKTLPQLLKENGYNTYAEMCWPIKPELGFGRGFCEYNMRPHKEQLRNAWSDSFIRRFKGGGFKEPWFLMFHTFALHRPRFVTRDFNKKKFGRVAYERAVSCLDSKLGEMLDCAGDNTVVILSSDHGEIYPKTKAREWLNNMWVAYYALLRKMRLSQSYFEGESHGFDLSEDVLKIPLLLKNLNGFPKGVVFNQLARSIDIAPTLIDALGLSGSLGGKVQGRSLVPLARGEKISDADLYLYARDVKLKSKERWLEGIRTNDFKLVFHPFGRNPGYELHDLRKGPLERQNLAAAMPEKVQELLAKIKDLKQGTEFTEKDAQKVIEKLRDLEYED